MQVLASPRIVLSLGRVGVVLGLMAAGVAHLLKNEPTGYLGLNLPGEIAQWCAVITGPALLVLIVPPLPARGDSNALVSATDARGVTRKVVYIETAGLGAGDMPKELRGKLAIEGLKNFQTRYTFPSLRWWLGAAVTGVGIAIIDATTPIRILAPLVVLAFGALSNGQNRLCAALVGFYLRHGRCPFCAYDLSQSPPDADGVRACSECGGAWRLERDAGSSSRPNAAKTNAPAPDVMPGATGRGR